MQIHNNQTNFGQSYKLHTKDQEDADRLDLMLRTRYNVERKPNSKKMLITSKKDYLSFLKVSEDIASARFPDKTETDGITKYAVMNNWARRKTQNDILEQIMSNEKKNAIDIKI